MSGSKRMHLGTVFCLVALLAQLILPLAHLSHLHGFEELSASAALDAGQKVRLLLGSAGSEEPHHSHHNAAACPICQAAFSSRYFTVPILPLSSVVSLPVYRFCNKPITSVIANPDILVTGPRAPPISL